jgi:DNA-binding LacI/PurR family transcriptional regulator
MFEQSHADGIILIGDMVGGDATLDALADRHPYIVGVTDRVSRRRVPGVYADNDVGTRLALDHLWSLGHRDIICVIDERMADGPFRAAVYERYLRDHDAADRIHVYHASQPDAAPAYRLGHELFSGFERTGHPTAIFAASDTIAIGLLQAAYQHGVRVPEELSIVGFDDVDAAAYMIPPLTTVDQRGTEMGTLAAGLILDMIEKQRPVGDVDDVVVTPRLVVRRSSAAAPADDGRQVARDGLEVEQR